MGEIEQSPINSNVLSDMILEGGESVTFLIQTT